MKEYANSVKLLLKSNREKLLNGDQNNGICYDGVVDNAIYNEQEIKVVVLMKETNGNTHDGQKQEIQHDWDYTGWLKHQQVDNEPEQRIRNSVEYIEYNVFYHSTFRKLCWWLSILFDTFETGTADAEKFLKNGAVDIDVVRKVLSRVALVNLKKTWGTEKTDPGALEAYALKQDISEILREELDVLDAKLVLCCSPDVYGIIKKVYGGKGTEIEAPSKVIAEKFMKVTCIDEKYFVEFYHPQYYGVKDAVFGAYAEEVFMWITETVLKSL